MRVFIPSRNRPNSRIFDMTKGLNIVIKTKEDLESYKKHEENHIIHYRPELKGLVDSRNYILSQGTKEDPWILMLDDDLDGVFRDFEKVKKISFDTAVEDIQNILKKIKNLNKIGVIGFNNKPFNKFYLKEKSSDFFLIHKNHFLHTNRSFLLNTELLKQYNFQFKGCPFDIKTHQSVGDDLMFNAFIQFHNIPSMKINTIRFSFDNSNSYFKGIYNIEMSIYQRLTLLKEYQFSNLRVSLNLIYEIQRHINELQLNGGDINKLCDTWDVLQKQTKF